MSPKYIDQVKWNVCALIRCGEILLFSVAIPTLFVACMCHTKIFSTIYWQTNGTNEMSKILWATQITKYSLVQLTRMEQQITYTSVFIPFLVLSFKVNIVLAASSNMVASHAVYVHVSFTQSTCVSSSSHFVHACRVSLIVYAHTHTHRHNAQTM